MYGQAVKDEHVACVDSPSDPLTTNHSAFRNLRNLKILIFVAQKSEAMRAFQNLQGSYFNRAIMKWNPCGIALRIASHESVILMRVNGETFAIREDQPSDRLGMNQELIAYDHFHNLL